jgi:hypothetical protein
VAGVGAGLSPVVFSSTGGVCPGPCQRISADDLVNVECMFDGSLPEIADLAALDAAGLVDAAAGWSRAENAACARKLAVLAEMFTRRTGLADDEREGWWIDPEAALSAELGAGWRWPKRIGGWACASGYRRWRHCLRPG